MSCSVVSGKATVRAQKVAAVRAEPKATHGGFLAAKSKGATEKSSRLEPYWMSERMLFLHLR